jgi:hypothetical protein
MVQKNAPLPKSELKRQIKKFLEDLDRGISIKSFAELCGISAQHLKDVFKYETEPLTENVQIRVNKGYDAWKRGVVKVMKRRDNTRYVDYRKEAYSPYMPSNKLVLTREGIKLKVGMANRHDYSDKNLDERG